MKRHQLCLLLSLCNKVLGDKFVEMEVRKLNRGLPLLYQQHITKTVEAADLRGSQEDFKHSVSWIAQNYMRRKDGFLKDFRNIKPPDEVALTLEEVFNAANLPIPEDLSQKASQIRLSESGQTQTPHP